MSLAVASDGVTQPNPAATNGTLDVEEQQLVESLGRLSQEPLTAPDRDALLVATTERLAEQLEGKNLGKMLVQVSEDPLLSEDT